MAESCPVNPPGASERRAPKTPPPRSAPRPAGATPSGRAPQAPLAEVTLAVENMHCGGCMRKVEKALSGLEGVRVARANLSQKRVLAAFDPAQVDSRRLVERLEEAGFRAAELMESDDEAGEARDRDLLRRLAVAGFAAANIMMLSVAVWAGMGSDMSVGEVGLFHWISALIALPAIAYAGQPFFASAIEALKLRRLNMDVPISLAILLATAMSLYQAARGTEQVYFDAAVSLLFFLLIGRFLDQRMRTRAAGAAANLMGLKAYSATVLSEGGGTERLAARLLSPGMRVLVATGERVPVDGRVLKGASEVDESLITGETLPRRVVPGGTVYAGTVNLGPPLEVEVQASDSGTLLAEIGRLMAAAEQARGRYVRLADRAASIYAPGVHALGALTFLGWMLAGAGWETSLTIAIAVLIITCPCALALAVPAVQVAASSRLFSKGIIMKAADGLERLAEVDHVVFDKTGTLTLGRARLVAPDAVPDDVLKGAATLAAASRHPLSRAVCEAARARGLAFAPAEGAEEVAGRGVLLETGRGTLRLGAPDWCGLNGTPGTEAGSGEAGDAESPVLAFARPGEAPYLLRFEDHLRTDARDVVGALVRAGYGVELLSGDREGAVVSAARALGIGTWRAAQRPDAKIARLEALREQGRRALMIGDGLNDAPALAAGHASLSPASAADISQTAADAIFQGEALAPVLETLAVAAQARRMALQNFAIAAAYNAISVPLAVAGLVTPLIAALAMSASSIVVTANALRLRSARLRLAPPRPGRRSAATSAMAVTGETRAQQEARP